MTSELERLAATSQPLRQQSATDGVRPWAKVGVTCHLPPNSCGWWMSVMTGGKENERRSWDLAPELLQTGCSSTDLRKPEPLHSTICGSEVSGCSRFSIILGTAVVLATWFGLLVRMWQNIIRCMSWGYDKLGSGSVCVLVCVVCTCLVVFVWTC